MEKRQLWLSTTDIESGWNINLWAYLIYLDCLRHGFLSLSVHKSGENLPLYKFHHPTFASKDTDHCQKLNVGDFPYTSSFTVDSLLRDERHRSWASEAECELPREEELANVNCLMERGVGFCGFPWPHSVIPSCFSSYDRLQLLFFSLRIVLTKKNTRRGCEKSTAQEVLYTLSDIYSQTHRTVYNNIKCLHN